MTVSAQKMAGATAKLTYPGRVPVFSLPSASADEGRLSGPAAARSKYNLVLAFVEDTAEGEEYLEALKGIYGDAVARAGRVIVVVTAPLDRTKALVRRVGPPFMVLADGDGETTRRLLGEEVGAALCVADTYGVVYFLEVVASTGELPPAQTAIEWLDFVEIQCPECTDASDSIWLGSD